MKKQIILGTFGFFIIILLFLFSTSFYTVKTGEVAIVSSWGKVSRIDREGLNFKIPIVQTKEIMEIRDKIYNFDDMSVSTKDMQSIILDLTVQSFVSDPEKLYRAFKGMHETNFIAPRTKEVVQASISKYTIEEFVSKRQELSNMIYQDLKDDFEAYGLAVSNVSITNHDFSMEYEKAIEAKKVAEQELSNMIYQDLKDDFEAYGLAVSNVSITNHDFSMEYEKAIEAKKVAEQEVERTKFEQEKIRVEAENKVFLAEYKLKEKELQAKANEVESASLSPVLLQKMAIEKWDGKLPQVSGENTQPIIKLGN